VLPGIAQSPGGCAAGAIERVFATFARGAPLASEESMRKPLLFALSVAGWLGCSSAPSTGSAQSSDGNTSSPPVPQAPLPAPLPAGEDTTLPLEVIGVQSTSANLRFNLPADLLSSATRTSLELTIHNVRYPGEASVSVNGGADIALDGKFVRGWGGTSTGLVDVPTGQLKTGQNILTFRFLVQKGIVTGYRVVAVNIVAGGAKTRTFTPELSHEDSTKWLPPAPSRVSQGETLYNLRKVETDGTYGGACSDCHTRTGADLQYFSYSNKSIRIRSVFHGFTADEGDSIASYVRVKNSDVKSEGTPFNPPFQPGPGNKVGTSSGAGLDAVLGSDAEFRDKVFGGTINATHTLAWAGATDPFLTPISFQLPDWHSWLPRTFDVRVADFFKANGLPDKWTEFYAAPTVGLLREIEGAYHGVIEKAHATMHPATGTPPASVDALTSYYGNLSVDEESQLWRLISVRAWDWMRSNGFAGPTHGANIKGYLQMAAPWAVGGIYRANANNPTDRTGKVDDNLAYQQASQWFWLSFVINPGQSQAQMNEPNDYSYFSDNVKQMPYDSADGAIHQAAFAYLRGSYEWHTSPATMGQRLHVRFANLPAGAVVPTHRKDTLELTGDETANLMLREMEADHAAFAAGEPMLPGYFDGWNGEQWSYVYDTLSAAQRDSMNAYLNATFSNGVGTAVAAGWTVKDPLHVLLPLKCRVPADCPPRFNGCNAAADHGHGACVIN